jgi:hypothetical protein
MEVWNAAHRGGETALARELKHARFALWKNPADLNCRQRGKLARIAEVNRRLYRAYLLKEELRLVFRVKGPYAVALLAVLSCGTGTLLAVVWVDLRFAFGCCSGMSGRRGLLALP